MAKLSDNFPYGTAALPADPWAVSYRCTVVSDRVAYSTGGSSPGAGRSSTFGAAQYGQCKIVTLPTNDWCCGPSINATSAANAAAGACYYLVARGDGVLRLYRNNVSAKTTNASFLSAGDTIRITHDGTGIVRAYRQVASTGDFNLVTWNDASTEYDDPGTEYTGTYVGFSGYYASTGASLWVIDDWEAGDLSELSASTPIARNALRGLGSIGQGNGFGMSRF